MSSLTEKVAVKAKGMKPEDAAAYMRAEREKLSQRKHAIGDDIHELTALLRDYEPPASKEGRGMRPKVETILPDNSKT